MSTSVSQPTPRTTLVDRIAAAIRQRIAVGEYPPQTYLPSERRLAEQFDASRGTVSTALRMLADVGLVEQYPGRGTQVASVPPAVSQKQLTVIANDYDPLYREARRTTRGVLSTLDRLDVEYRRLDLDALSEDPMRQFNGDDAVIFHEASKTLQPIALALAQRGTPIAVANIERPDLDVPGTRVDHADIVRRAVDLLVNFGHHRVGFVGNDPTAHFYGAMQQQFIASMQAHGRSVDPAWVVGAAGAKALVGYRGAKRMLERDAPVTAIVTGRDAYAEGVCQAIWDLGLHVGRDVSIVSYDDVTWINESDDQPFLTTFREPCEQMGAEAVRMLMARLVDGDYAVRQRTFEAPLILRQSAGPVAPPKPRYTRLSEEARYCSKATRTTGGHHHVPHPTS